MKWSDRKQFRLKSYTSSDLQLEPQNLKPDFNGFQQVRRRPGYTFYAFYARCHGDSRLCTGTPTVRGQIPNAGMPGRVNLQLARGLGLMIGCQRGPVALGHVVKTNTP
jgi:hypothetical protein